MIIHYAMNPADESWVLNNAMSSPDAVKEFLKKTGLDSEGFIPASVNFYTHNFLQVKNSIELNNHYIAQRVKEDQVLAIQQKQEREAQERIRQEEAERREKEQKDLEAFAEWKAAQEAIGAKRAQGVSDTGTLNADKKGELDGTDYNNPKAQAALDKKQEAGTTSNTANNKKVKELLASRKSNKE